MNDVLLLVVLLFLSGFFSGAEIALFSLGAEKIHALRNNTESKRKLQQIARLELLKSDPERLLVTILIGNNVVNVGASALATVMATNFAATSGFEQNQTLVLGAVTGVMTFMILLFGEITPKSLAHKYATRFSLWIAPLILSLQFILTPIVWPLSRLVKKFSGDEEVRHGLDEDELKAALELSEKEGKIDEDEKKWTEKIFELGEHSVESVMTPRSKIFGLEDSTSVTDALEQIREQHFSRIPIFHKDLDHIVGILTVRGIMEKITEMDLEKTKVANCPLYAPFKVPITMRVDTLLKEFQAQKMHMGLVYDEFGGLVGLITMEDVLEEVFGEIHDEQDEAVVQIRQTGKMAFEMNGEAEMEAIEEFVQSKLDPSPEKFPWKLEDENKTVGLFILEQLEKFPSGGEDFILEAGDLKFKFTVESIVEERIEVVKLEIKKA